jgi:outer membrane protein
MATPAHAQGEPDLIFDLGAGMLVKPNFEGASTTMIAPYPIVALKYLRLPGLFTIGGGPDDGFSLFPSLNVVGTRKDTSATYLNGLGTVDTAVELGLGASYRYGFVKGSIEARRGFGGHEGFVGTVAVDLIAQPVAGLTVEAGPRLGFADQSYMQTYFGVTAAQAVTSGYAAYSPDGGFKSVGLAAKATYELTPEWRLHFGAGYDRLIGDAARSPVLKAGGSLDQFTARAGVSYRFSVDLFD